MSQFFKCQMNIFKNERLKLSCQMFHQKSLNILKLPKLTDKEGIVAHAFLQKEFM